MIVEEDATSNRTQGDSEEEEDSEDKRLEISLRMRPICLRIGPNRIFFMLGGKPRSKK